MKITILLLSSLLMFGCVSFGKKPLPPECLAVTITKYEYRVPDIPSKITDPVEKPFVESWDGKTQVDVEAYIIELHQAVDAGNLKLHELNNYLDALRVQEELKKSERNE